MSKSIPKSSYWKTGNSYLVKILHYVLAKKILIERLKKSSCLWFCLRFHFFFFFFLFSYYYHIFLIGISLNNQHHPGHKIITCSMYIELRLLQKRFICQISSFCGKNTLCGGWGAISRVKLQKSSRAFLSEVGELKAENRVLAVSSMLH